MALARTAGGMILSGPNDCLGSMKAVRMREALRHSLFSVEGIGLLCCELEAKNKKGSSN